MDINERGDREDHMEEEDIPGGYPESFGLSGSWDARNFLLRKPGGSEKYRECLKNHAVGIGGTAVDGCGEFMAAGEEGTLDGLRCAACGCHRNFHRKETAVYGHLHRNQYSPYLRAAPPYHSGYLQLTVAAGQLHQRPLALPSTLREDLEEEEEDASNRSRSGGGGSGSGSGVMRKRSRTKFTAEQKERMREFAEKVGWRMQKQDQAAVERFCSEIGIERQALKVWMHNHKHAYAHAMVSAN